MSDGQALEACLAAGGVAVFPADTVYGLACDPEHRAAVERLYALKGRPIDKPSAVMFFQRESALAALPELGQATREAASRLLPGAVTLIVANPARRFALACGDDPTALGLRVPRAPRLADCRRPALQSSANLAGGPDPVSLDEVPDRIRDGVDLVIDGGKLPGTPSTVVDLRAFDASGEWQLLRVGAVDEATVGRLLGEAGSG